MTKMANLRRHGKRRRRRFLPNDLQPLPEPRQFIPRDKVPLDRVLGYDAHTDTAAR